MSTLCEKLELQNGQLKADIESRTMCITCERELQNCNLQAENERLKGSLKIAQGLCKTLEKAKSNEHEQWFIRCCEINTERDKYRQALQEIKEICNNSHTSASEDYYRTADKIQAKINEVIGAEL